MLSKARPVFINFTLLAFLNASIPVTANAGAAQVLASKLGAGQVTLTEDMLEPKASEYVMRRYPGEHLIPVRILSGVRNPGTYYFPEGIDLISAVALSGGLTSNANPDKVHWNQWATQKTTTLSMEEVVREPKIMNPKLGTNDVLLVEDSKPFISNNTVLVVTLITGLLSIALSARALTK